MMNSNFWDNIGRTVTGAADTVGRKATEVARRGKAEKSDLQPRARYEAGL